MECPEQKLKIKPEEAGPRRKNKLAGSHGEWRPSQRGIQAWFRRGSKAWLGEFVTASHVGILGSRSDL